MKIISDNGVSKVWVNEDIDPGFIYKKQPSFLTTNEIWCLERLYFTGYVPFAEQVELEIIKMEFIKREAVTNPSLFMSHFPLVLIILEEQGISHGDLTSPNIIVKNNKPYLIDFSESRLACDPRVSKRPEGDKYWLRKTMVELCESSQ